MTLVQENFLTTSDDVVAMGDEGMAVKAEACDGGGQQMVKINIKKKEEQHGLRQHGLQR